MAPRTKRRTAEDTPGGKPANLNLKGSIKTTYTIGSVNGDYQSLSKLLDKIAFDPDTDCLWFAGNSVNPTA